MEGPSGVILMDIYFVVGVSYDKSGFVNKSLQSSIEQIQPLKASSMYS